VQAIQPLQLQAARPLASSVAHPYVCVHLASSHPSTCRPTARGTAPGPPSRKPRVRRHRSREESNSNPFSLRKSSLSRARESDASVCTRRHQVTRLSPWPPSRPESRRSLRRASSPAYPRSARREGPQRSSLPQRAVCEECSDHVGGHGCILGVLGRTWRIHCPPRHRHALRTLLS